ncbi:hydrolase [Oryctes borbonicus]|uniref:Carboxylic ester hydrolase n=1 Tax=Oryctes borbonicus TaxID=1629725 RepID=A0A0T6B8R1_9SCAR|nr:hydrolase [Oryctes borbonicus]
MCVQKDWLGKIQGQEDCLYLNVYTPEILTKTLRPVMVYIHGGGFVEGHGRYEMFGPEFLIPEGVILVTLHYRLGLFGFLNFENTDVGAFGNMGLKDQNMALRWVQKNIEKFGGDRNSVTIFGESAGGGSVHMHMLSPMSQGLFHKVIAQSGSALNAWCTNGQKNTGVIAAKALGYKGESELKMLPFLQGKTTEEIMKIQENITAIIPIHEPGLVGPIVEDIKDDIAFLPNSIEELIAAKEYQEVPFMLGVTDEEIIVIDVVSMLTSGKPMEIPREMALMYTLNLKDGNAKAEVLKKIDDFYFKNADPADRTGTLHLIGDAWIYYGVYKSLLAHSKREHKNLYLYVLSADTQLNYMKRMHPVTAKYKGASHMDDLGYLFKTKYTPDLKPDSLEATVMQRAVKLWTNFAKHGNPTPKHEEFSITWKRVQTGAMNFLNIGNENLELGINPYSERTSFWDKLHEEYADGKTSSSRSEL